MFPHRVPVFQPAPNGRLLWFREDRQQFLDAGTGEVEREGVVLTVLLLKLPQHPRLDQRLKMPADLFRQGRDP